MQSNLIKLKIVYKIKFDKNASRGSATVGREMMLPSKTNLLENAGSSVMTQNPNLPPCLPDYSVIEIINFPYDLLRLVLSAFELYSDIHVYNPTESHSGTLLFYSWDLLIYYQAWLETCEPIWVFLSSAGGWSVPLPMWAIVMFQTACRGLASAEIFISFLACFTFFWCSSPVWWFFASRLGNIHDFFFFTSARLVVSSFDFWTKLRSTSSVLWINSSAVPLRMNFVPLCDKEKKWGFSSLIR